MTPRIIILSDGHANLGICDPDELREHAGELRMRGVLTSTLGIGDGYDEQLLRSIAESGGGRLHGAELMSEVSSVLLGEPDDIFGTLVEDAQIILPAPRIHVDLLGKDAPQTPDGRIVASLGPIQNNTGRIAIFKVTCPKARRGEKLDLGIVANARAIDNRSMPETDALSVSLIAADRHDNKRQLRDTGTVLTAARTWSAHIVGEAARLNRDGAYEEARTYIEGELRHFRRYVDTLPGGGEMVGELELLARRVGSQFSSRMRKEMVVQSAMFRENRVDHRGDGKAGWSARMERGD